MPRIREVIESTLLVAVPHATIAVAVQELFGVPLTSEAVVAFQKLFFWVEILTVSQLRIAVEDRVRVALHAVASAETNLATVACALEDDPRVIASRLPATPASWPIVLAAAGLSSNGKGFNRVRARRTHEPGSAGRPTYH
jgi:hypothetical protein